ncbi:ATP-binding protein [uncultured Ruminococcus sp.]|uniref:ATP-binding protein n=1 Tax=uncultured Ruminococcus sp. TaxID=165186 RepID=UPI0025CCBE23|nr:ATP-binding protein [uncultured Ruminococcus sp.]
MGYSSSVYKAAADRLFERRLKAEKDADRRRAAIYKKLPRTKELEKEISHCGIQAARAVISGGNVTEEMKNLRDRNLAMQSELAEILTSNGYDKDVFEPSYSCKRCSDTGYYEENGRTLVCNCLKQALVSCACEELNRTAPLSLSTFESFSLDYYDKEVDSKTGISPCNHMSKILRYCQNYADNFTKNSESILMKGATGLGKTHLSLAIANEVIKKGYGVIYVSAPSLMQKLEKQYFSRNDDVATDMLIECDLLIVDDLGTEFHSQLSVSLMYNIFNSRMLANKPVIINTNFDLRELEKNYTERFVSRVIGNAQKLDFLGSDIRVRKK